VARATHANIYRFDSDHFEKIGKFPLQQSGKYRVNENGEEFFASVFLPASFRGDATGARPMAGPMTGSASNYGAQLRI